MPIVEIRSLTKEEAGERAANFRIDGVPVEIVPDGNGTFTVRAIYPDDPAASPPSGGP